MARKKIDKPAPRSYKVKPHAERQFESDPDFGFRYTTPGPFCRVKRLQQGRCATQFNFVDGKPMLRLCGSFDKPGELVPVDSPEDALRKASKFCKVSKAEVQQTWAEGGGMEGAEAPKFNWLLLGLLGGAVVGRLLIPRNQ
jgi:hypothetical protein